MYTPFTEVKERVSVQDAARFYGATINERGWALCQFHNDHSASMSFKNGWYRCWSCGASGDVIDYVGRLFDLGAKDAVKKLNEDFCLGFDFGTCTPEMKEEAARRRRAAGEKRRFEEWRVAFISRLCAASRAAHLLPDNEVFTERGALALRMQATCDYLANALESGNEKEIKQIYNERGMIAEWLNLILAKQSA